MSKIPISVIRALICSFAVGGFVAPVLADDNILLNGTFETGSFSNWSLTPGPEGAYGVNSSAPFAGTYGAVFSSTEPTDAISQDLTTVEDFKYRVNFRLAKELNGINDFSVFWNNSLIANWSDSSPFAYTEYNLVVYGAPGVTSNLRFEGYTSQGAFLLDNVSVVPEPSTCALAVTAVAGLAAVARRRRRAGKTKDQQAALA